MFKDTKLKLKLSIRITSPFNSAIAILGNDTCFGSQEASGCALKDIPTLQKVSDICVYFEVNNTIYYHILSSIYDILEKLTLD